VPVNGPSRPWPRRRHDRDGHASGARRPARYSALGLLRRGLAGTDWPRAWREHDLAPAYDVVIVGAGVHGLATAYYLAANHGITNVAVIDKGYLGGGGSGRNTAIIRSNYLTPEGVRFYDRSVKLYEALAADLNFNVMFSQRGHLTLAHNDGSLRTMRWRAEVNKLEGVASEVIGPERIAELVPFMDVSAGARYPILGALYHPPGGTIRHDAVNWGYARAADARGVHLHQQTELLGIDVEHGRVTGVTTSRGRISTPVVVNCTAGWSSLVSAMAGVSMPIVTSPLQAAVTEPVKVFLETVVVSGTLHVYISQTDRGELVFGASVDPYPSYSMRGSLEFTEELAGHVLELMPSIARLRVLRQWAGLCDMTPDYSPVMGVTPVEGFLVDVGWGTYGFKAGPVAGETMAELVATGKTPELIAAFDLARFAEGRLVGEKGAASVGH
jgi:sarcosine oxidase, subunit beta